MYIQTWTYIQIPLFFSIAIILNSDFFFVVLQRRIHFYESVEFGADKSLAGNAYGKWVLTDLKELL